MTPEALERMARELMQAHGLLRCGWRFTIGRKKRSLGTCYYDRHEIVIHCHFAEHGTEEQLRETLLHEIAHALAGPDVQSHGKEWQDIARRIGCKEATRCASSPDIPMPEGKFQAICPNCTRIFHWYRKPSKRAKFNCRDCGRERGKLNPMPAERLQKVKELLGIVPKKKSLFD